MNFPVTLGEKIHFTYFFKQKALYLQSASEGARMMTKTWTVFGKSVLRISDLVFLKEMRRKICARLFGLPSGLVIVKVIVYSLICRPYKLNRVNKD